MAAEYTVIHYAPAQWVGTVLDRVIKCEYARTDSDAGAMTLTVPDDYYDPSLFQPYSRFVVERALGSQPPYADLETVWFLADGPHYDLDESGTTVIVMECVDALGWVLGGANIAYQQYSEQAYKLDYADDMGKAIVRENMGSLATDTDRDLSAVLSVQPDASAAPIVRLGFERLQVLEALAKIRDASAADDTPTWMGFDVVLANAITGLLEFRTYTGQRGIDHRFPGGSPPVILSPERGNLKSVRVGSLYRGAASYIYAGGPGVGSIRAIAPASDAAMIALGPFGRREVFVDTQAPDAESLQYEANAALRRLRPRRFFSGEIVETEDTLRGIHWDYGDYATGSYRDVTMDVRVDKIAVTLTPGPGGGLVDKVAAFLRGETDA